jgi:hypothetical protein
MAKKRTLWIVFISGFILLLTGFGSSYYWITRIYLPEQMDANLDSQLFIQWEAEDTFSPPDDDRISKKQMALFMQVNESLTADIQKIRQQFEENSWRIAFDLIKIQPEWAGKKYRALKKHNLSPKEYDWIVNRVTDFWIYRWKEESLDRLREFGWEFEDSSDTKVKPVNYDLFSAYEEDLNRIFDILWPEKSIADSEMPDTSEKK